MKFFVIVSILMLASSGASAGNIDGDIEPRMGFSDGRVTFGYTQDRTDVLTGKWKLRYGVKVDDLFGEDTQHRFVLDGIYSYRENVRFRLGVSARCFSNGHCDPGVRAGVRAELSRFDVRAGISRVEGDSVKFRTEFLPRGKRIDVGFATRDTAVGPLFRFNKVKVGGYNVELVGGILINPLTGEETTISRLSVSN